MGIKEVDEKYGVGMYWPYSVDLPELFEKTGFRAVQVDAVAVPIIAYDSRNCYKEKIAIVEL